MNAPEISYDELDNIDLRPPVPWNEAFFSVMLLFAFVPLTAVLGLERLTPGVRAIDARFVWLAPFYFVLYGYLVHALLVWPMATLVYPQSQHRMSTGKRVLYLMVMQALPLLSFAYYLGNVNEALDYFELFAAIVPGVALGAAFFETTRRSWYAAAVLAVATFPPLFLLNDVLGPLPVLWNYASNGAGFYLFRGASQAGAVLFAFFILVRRGSLTSKLSAFRSASAALSLSFAILLYAIPAVMALREGASPAFPRDFSWPAYIALFFLLGRRGPRVWRAALATACALAAIAALQLGTLIFSGSAGLSPLLAVTHYTIALGVFAALAGALSRPIARELFAQVI